MTSDRKLTPPGETNQAAALFRLIQELPCAIRASGEARARRPISHRIEVLSNEFHCLSEDELQQLSSDELITYIREASDAARPDCASTALAILCWRHFDDIVRRVRMRVPAADVEDVAMTALLAALKSSFDGVAEGQFVNWLHRIVDRRGIADYYRKRETEPDQTPLPTEHAGEDEIWGDEPAEQDETGAVDVQSIIDEFLGGLSDAHRDVVEHNVFEDLDANDTADQVNEDHPDLDPPMSQANVHQIVSRFRKCVRAKLSGDADPDPD